MLRIWNTPNIPENKRLVRKVFDMAVDAHKDMRRQSGEPYIYHPPDVARIADGLTKIDKIFDSSTSSLQAENFKRILQTMSENVRVTLIKLSDRLNNMESLDVMYREKQLKITSETLYLYAPLAHRLGLYSIKNKLEDFALKYTEPEIYSTFTTKLKESSKERTRFSNKFIFPLLKVLISKALNTGLKLLIINLLNKRA